MADIIVRGLDESVHRVLRDSAAEAGLSMNQLVRRVLSRHVDALVRSREAGGCCGWSTLRTTADLVGLVAAGTAANLGLPCAVCRAWIAASTPRRALYVETLRSSVHRDG